MLKSENIYSGYGSIAILKGISFELKDNETKLLLSLNGMGKTTLLKVLSGLLPVVSGKIFFNGEEVTKKDSSYRVSKGLLYVPEWGIFPQLTIKENLIVASYKIKNNLSENLERAISLFPELKSRMNHRAASLSGGQRKMLLISMAMASGAKTLLLDEPSSGLSPIFVEKIVEVLKECRKRGISLLIAEQNPSFMNMADEVIFLENGAISFVGKPESIKKNEEIVRKIFSLD